MIRKGRQVLRAVESRKDGRWHYYRLSGRDAPPAVSRALQWMFAALDGNPMVAEDGRQLKCVLRKDVEELCDLYKR